ncbi:MAG: hypothetical protein HRT58_20260 [Crocinitomicaceae bacterium]|nr:protein phosphatase 1 regulatory subunit 42 [Flavobacteriales bacterium]NQZ38005.1 hypothetical protein [Crocinitomicaceae bacterium]
MSKLILLLAVAFSSSSFSQVSCSYCTSIVDALENPAGVTHLDLHALGLGELPKEINQFVNLKSLNLSENFIEEINFDTLQLSGLEVLDLSKNPGFNTFALEGIETCSPNLKNINFSNTNCISVSPTLAKCKELETLNLSNNWIQFLPNQLGDLDKLLTLNLGNNQLKLLQFLDDLWRLEELDISENEDLHLKEVGASLLLKESLKSLIVTPEEKLSKGLPNVFEVLAIEKLTIKNGSIDALNSRLSRNVTLKTIVLNNVNVLNPKRFTAWLNRMTNVSRVEFKNMVVPKLLDEIVSVNVMQFDYCTISDKDELRKVKPRITMIAHATDISQGNYVGNAKILDLAESNVVVTPDVVVMNEDMIDNKLVPIVKQREQVNIIQADTPCRVRTENSFFEIPSQAFLTQSGQIYEGEVKVVVKEYMDPIENALTSTPMVYRTNGRNELFSSSGMLDFRAYDDQGNELKPNPESTIQVQMNDLQPSQSPDFYTFNESTNNWESELPPVPSRLGRRKSRVLDSLNKMSAAEVTGFQQVPIFLNLKYKKSRKDPYILSFTVEKGRRTPIRKVPSFTRFLYSSNADQSWVARRNSWKIDTTLTYEMKNVLSKVKKDTRRVKRSWGDEPNSGNFVVPRVIKKLEMEPNIENDNYILSFVYQDTVRRFPVVPSFGGSIRRIQAKEKANFKSFLVAQKTAKKEQAVIERYEKTVLEKYAQVVRERRAQAIAMFPDFETANREYLRFGLSSFGLVNCDYFFRNVPDNYIAFDTIGTDVNGRAINVPYDVRNVYLDDNVFVATSSDKVPIYKNRRAIIFFLISPLEIAIVKGWERLKNGFCQPTVERISISESDSPAAIKRKILAAGG